MDEKLMNAIHSNHKIAYEKQLVAKQKKEEKERKEELSKQRALMTFIFTIILIVFIFLGWI